MQPGREAPFRRTVAAFAEFRPTVATLVAGELVA